jgi:GTPase SAR1 family protein
MPLPRILVLITGTALILGMMLWLVNALYRLYIQISFTAPFLANILLLLLILLLAILVGAFIYYIYIITSPKQNSPQGQKNKLSPKVPAEKAEAAGENLKAVRQQVQQIQDEVARQELLMRSKEIESILARGELLVVVFGTGSAGKTSLINALIGRVVGKVGAPMGSTEVGETYTLKLKGINRQILITDTPGILEAGVAGTEREKLARKLATEADLLLFVVDNDLRQSEYKPLQDLAQIGKRSILILNKSDLYTDGDREVIMARLRERVRGYIATMDVVAITANPQMVALENGEVIAPDPEIMPLIKRLAAILRAEGEDLIADNILLQSQKLGEEARKILEQQRRRQAEKIVDRFQWIGAGVIAVTPLPVVDVLAAAAVNAQMVIEIGRVYGCELNMERGKELALSLGKTLASLGVVKGAIELVSAALRTNVATYFVGKAIQGITAAYLTRIAGKSFIEYFRHNQDWGDGGITEVVQRQFQLNRKQEFVKSFMQEALHKVMPPLVIHEKEAELITDTSTLLHTRPAKEPLKPIKPEDDW